MKCILVLEDNEDRRAAMRRWHADRLSMYELLVTDLVPIKVTSIKGNASAF